MLYDRGTGWFEWKFSNFRDRCSYIVDFPFNVVEALNEYFKTGEAQFVVFDAEGWDYIFKFDSNLSVGETVLYEDIHEFAEDFVSELEESLESWSHFPVRRESDKNYKELVDGIVEIRLELMDMELLGKWVEAVSH